MFAMRCGCHVLTEKPLDLSLSKCLALEESQKQTGKVVGVTMQMPESGILSWLNISALGTDEEVAERIRTDANIMVNQGTPYGSQGRGHIRIVTACFADDLDAQRRFDQIRAILRQLAREKGLAPE